MKMSCQETNPGGTLVSPGFDAIGAEPKGSSHSPASEGTSVLPVIRNVSWSSASGSALTCFGPSRLRHFVISIPKILRRFFLRDRRLLADLSHSRMGVAEDPSPEHGCRNRLRSGRRNRCANTRRFFRPLSSSPGSISRSWVAPLGRSSTAVLIRLPVGAPVCPKTAFLALPSGSARDRSARPRSFLSSHSVPCAVGHIRGEGVRRSIEWLILRLIKVRARVSCHARKWHVHMSTAFPLAHHYQEVFDSGFPVRRLFR